MLLTMGFLNSYRGLLTADDINKQENIEMLLEANQYNEFTHYMVCTSNRLRIKPDSIKNTIDTIFFSLMEQIDEFEWKEHTFRIPANLGGYRTKMSVNGATVTLTVETGHIEFFNNVILFLEWLTRLLSFPKKLNTLMKFHIEYIGQTELTKEYIRFHEHKKISTILSDANSNRPNKEVRLLLLSFQSPIIISMTSPDLDSDLRFDGTNGELVKQLPKNEWKNIVEAAMIHFFKPKLNVHYKENFPSDKHTSYTFFYKKDIRSVFVELHGNYTSYVLGSDAIDYISSSYRIQYGLSENLDGVYIGDNNVQDIDWYLKLMED